MIRSDPPRLSSLMFALLLLLCIAALAFVRADLRFPFSLLNDDVYQIPMALLAVDDSLFPRDTLLRWHRQFLPEPFLLALGFSLRLLGINATYLLASILLNVVFFAGIHRYARDVLNNARLAWIVCFLSVVPWFSPGMISYGAPTPSEVIPRNIILALLPWFLCCFPRPGRWLHMGFFFFLLGLAANIHPLSSFHLLIIFAAAAIVRSPKPKAMVLNAAVMPASFLIGAFPSALHYLATFPLGGQPATEVLHARVPYLFPTTGEVTQTIVLWLIPYLLMTVSVLKAKAAQRQLSDSDRFNIIFFILCFCLGAIGILLAHVNPSLAKFQLVRTWGYLRLVLYVYSAAFICRLMDKDVRRSVVILSVVIMFLPQAAKFARLAIYSPQFSHRSDSLLVGPKRAAFLALAAECRAQTDEDALFLVPPPELAVFRSAALRSIFVSHKDGAPVSFSRDYAEEWLQRYRAAEEAYRSSKFSQIVQRYGVDFIVFDLLRGTPPAGGTRALYSNEFFTVYDAADIVARENALKLSHK